MNEKPVTQWLKEEGSFAVAEASHSSRQRSGTQVATLEHNLAIFVQPLKVLDTHKWFGDAELRLDALVVHGGTDDVYRPQTLRFPRVKNGDNLTGSERGLLIYLGKPKHFISISIMLARDTKDSDDLAQLIHTSVATDEVNSATSALAALALPGAPTATVQAGLSAAIALGDVAYKVVRNVSPTCLGLYRANWLAQKDRFGVGRHPRTGTHRVADFEIGCQVELDRRAHPKGTG